MSNITAARTVMARLSRTGIAGLAVAVGVLVGVHGAPAAGTPQVTVRTATPAGQNSDGITVTGTGKVLGTPDLLTVNMGIETHAAHVSDALGDANTRLQSLVTSFSSGGVPAADIQTQSASITQHYNSSGVIDGYSVAEAVVVTLRDLSRAGTQLDAAAQQGGDAVRLQGMQLSISDTSALLAAARKAAMDDAHAKAEQFASAGGARLGQLRSVSAVNGDATQPIPFASGSGGLATASSAVPVSPGQQNVDVVVTTGWDLTS